MTRYWNLKAYTFWSTLAGTAQRSKKLTQKSIDKMRKNDGKTLVVVNARALVPDESIPHTFHLGFPLKKMEVKILIYIEKLLWSKTGLQEKRRRSVFCIKSDSLFIRSEQKWSKKVPLRWFMASLHRVHLGKVFFHVQNCNNANRWYGLRDGKSPLLDNCLGMYFFPLLTVVFKHCPRKSVVTWR